MLASVATDLPTRILLNPQRTRWMERIIIGDDSCAPLAPSKETIAETVKKEAKEAPGAPVQHGQPIISSWAETAWGRAGRSPSREEHRTTSVTRQQQRTGGFPAGRFVGYAETVPGERENLATPQPQNPKLVKVRFPSTHLRPIYNAQADHAVGEQCKASTRTEVTTQARGAFWSSGVNRQDHMVGQADCRGIGAEDWLDVTHAMLAFGRSEFDS